MWRCRIFFFLFFLPLFVHAQTQDSSYYITNAQAYDKLLPEIHLDFLTPGAFTRDSAAFLASHSPHTIECWTTIVNFQKKKRDTLQPDGIRVHFDNEGRFAGQQGLFPGGAEKQSTTIRYLRGNLLSQIARSSITDIADTAVFSYNKAGLLSQICERIRIGTDDTTFCVRFLYDNNNRLVVAQNITFPDEPGTFTFSYNSAGKLVQRQFLNPVTGAVLFTDTLEYSFADAAKTKAQVRHLVRPAGSSRWVLVDQVVFDETKRIVHYEVKANNTTTPLHGMKPGWTIDYTYDTAGRKQRVIQMDSTKTQERRIEYAYGKPGIPDTVTTTEYAILEGQRSKMREEIEVRYFDAQGRISYSEKSIYTLTGTGRKRKLKLTSKELVNYLWK